MTKISEIVFLQPPHPNAAVVALAAQTAKLESGEHSSFFAAAEERGMKGKREMLREGEEEESTEAADNRFDASMLMEHRIFYQTIVS